MTMRVPMAIPTGVVSPLVWVGAPQEFDKLGETVHHALSCLQLGWLNFLIGLSSNTGELKQNLD